MTPAANDPTQNKSISARAVRWWLNQFGCFFTQGRCEHIQTQPRPGTLEDTLRCAELQKTQRPTTQLLCDTQPQGVAEASIETAVVCFVLLGPGEFKTGHCRTAMVEPVGTAPRKYREYDSSHIPAAGVTFPADDSASTCLTWSARPQTPSGIAKYRQSRLHEPGQIYKHFGVAGDAVDRTQVYGRVRQTHICSRRWMSWTCFA